MKSVLNRGPIAWMTGNPVAANLLMAVLLIGGLVGVFQVRQEVFPEFELDIVAVSVPYPGASPADVEQGIVLAVEEAVRGIDGVRRVSSTSTEGLGSVFVELLVDADTDQVLADVKTAVDRIQSFPENAEKADVTSITARREVVSLVLSGDLDRATLKALGEQARTRLLAHPDVTQAQLTGLPPLEISIEVPRETLRAYDLTLDQIAAQVSAASVELPGGGIRTDGGEVLVRVADRRLTAEALSDVVVRGTASGANLRLGDIATLRDGFAETDQAAFYDGQPAVRITAFRVGSETPAEVAAATRALADELSAELPDAVQVSIWNDDSVSLDQRIDLLVRNGAIGLGLVFLALTLFLNLRLAVWVAVGIPISFLGTLFLMPGMDLSINMVTLFALIVTLGLVVDDAIIVGENIYTKTQEGLPRFKAAIEGAREMAGPVTFSVLTSMAAFAPLLFVPGVWGKIFRFMPLVVLTVLFFSLVESFFILPAHLGHGRDRTPRGLLGRLLAAQGRITALLERIPKQAYRPVLQAALRQRYITLSVAIAALLASLGAVASGLIPFAPFPSVESDLVYATARLPYGTPVERTAEVQRVLEGAVAEAVAEIGDEDLVRAMYSKLGEGPFRNEGAEIGGHLVTVELQLAPSAERAVSSAEFVGAWSSHVPPMAAIDSLQFESSLGPGAGAAVDVQLSHSDTAVLAAASSEFTEALRSFPALTDIRNAYAQGKPQIDLSLLPRAHTMQLTSGEVARQVRGAFFGSEAFRNQRGRDELKVMVRLPEDQRSSEYHLEELMIRTPAGGEVPLAWVAQVDRGRAPTSIDRENGERVVNVTAGLAPGVPSSREVVSSLKDEVIPELAERYPGLDISFVGESREANEAFAKLGQNYLLALLVIFALLAIPFRSYTQPLIIMAAIPFGFVGAVIGHVLMGYELSMISFFGIIALSGVVVNDSLVLIDTTNKARAAGASAWDAIVAGGLRRIRPILLTSVTTFFGLAPMIFETEMQARFLVPMAISLGFGILFTTALILLVVPSLYLILEDVRGLFSLEEEAEPVVAGELQALPLAAK